MPQRYILILPDWQHNHCMKKVIKNSLQDIRERKGFTREFVAEKLNTSETHIYRLEKGLRKIDEDWLEKFSKLYACKKSELLGENDTVLQIPLVGYVGAGTTMRCNNMTDEPIDWIEPATIGFSRNFDPGTMFIQVQGNSMVGSADDGDYLWLNSNDVFHGADIDKLINKRAVVICKDGYNFYKKIKRGNKKGTYNLHSINTPEIMEDKQLQCAYVVHGVVYR